MSLPGASTAAHLRFALRAPRSELTRRGLLALGGSGAAGVALGGCGTEDDPREDGKDPELVGNAIAAEHAYGLGAKAFGDQQGVSKQIAEQSAARADELNSLDVEGAPTSPDSEAGGENVNDAALAAISAYREIARLGSSEELRADGIQFLAQVAAELAALNELQDNPIEHIVPSAFVTGLSESPLESADDAPAAGAQPTTSTTSTTSTEGG